jgi:hypothetical protein
LSIELEIETSVCAVWLRGLDLPQWPLFLRLCEWSGKEPGYFLDASLPDIPPDTLKIPSVSSGEDPIAIRLPGVQSRLHAPNDSRFSYLSAFRPMGFGIAVGDILVHHTLPSGMSQACVRHHILLERATGYEVRYCTDFRNGRAILHSGLRDAADSAFDQMICPAIPSPDLALAIYQVDCLVRSNLSTQ